MNHRLVVVILVAALALSCRTSTPKPAEGSAPSAPPQSAAARFCTSLIDAAVKRSVRCFGGTSEGWAAVIGADSECPAMARAVEAGRTRIDEGQIDACLASMRDGDCADQRPAESCAALVGLVPVGGACTPMHVGECVLGSFCKPGVGCEGTCVAYANLGQSCAKTPCAGGLICAAGTCKAFPKKGEACTTGCSGGLRCVAEKCEERTPGAACRTSADCLGNEFCPAAAEGSARTCQKTKAIGEACTEGGHECMRWTYCAEGKCRAFPKVGEACGAVAAGEYAGCLNAFCDRGTGTCVAPHRTGEPCDPQAQGRTCEGRCDPQASVCVEACGG